MTEVFPLFSTPVYSSYIREIDFSSLLNVAKETEYTASQNGISISFKEYLIDDFKNLKSQIVDHVNNYLYNVLEINDSFQYYFTDSWFIKTEPQGESKFFHFHSNSLFSGVFYINAPPDCGNLMFSKNSTGSGSGEYVNIDIPYKNYNVFNSSNYSLFPETGKILIFPSYINHRILANKLNEDRYSFAFNILPENFTSNNTGNRVLDRGL